LRPQFLDTSPPKTYVHVCTYKSNKVIIANLNLTNLEFIHKISDEKSPPGDT
jgi:hypothetical protein